MSLVTLAIVGKDNTPLYLCDFDFDDHAHSSLLTPTPTQERRQQKSTSNDFRKEEQEPSNDFRKEEEEEDTFGFFETNTKNMNESSSLKHQVREIKLGTLSEIISGGMVKHVHTSFSMSNAFYDG